MRSALPLLALFALACGDDTQPTASDGPPADGHTVDARSPDALSDGATLDAPRPDAPSDGATLDAPGPDAPPPDADNRLTTGASCVNDSDCLSGNCAVAQAGKRCATTTCSATCQVIDTAGTACVAASAGTDPKNECTANMATCKQEQCNGTTGTHACDIANGTSCGGASCSSGVETSHICGAGSCGSIAVSCLHYSCGATQCNSSCPARGNNANCAAGNCCNGAMACVTNTLATSCGSGCVDCTTGVSDKACVNGGCGCTSAADCGGMGPAGDTVSGVCVPGAGKADCGANSAGHVCGTTHTCGCTTNADCPAGIAPMCVPITAARCGCGTEGVVCSASQRCTDFTSGATCQGAPGQACNSGTECASGTCSGG